MMNRILTKKWLRYVSWTLPLMAIAVLVVRLPSAHAELTIGSEAPQLDIEHWLSDGGGKLKPVTEFQKGKVYVVEFWATWCGPCVASMPHIAELQKKMLDKGVQVVSVSDEDLETVQEFLERNVPAGIARSIQKPQASAESKAGDQASDSEAVTASPKMTFGELTSAYSLATDPDQSVYKDYMEASGENGIPTAFIVGKQGIIEWIGHPMELDDPLSQVVEDRWDRQAYIKLRAQQRELEEAVMQVYTKVQEGDVEAGLKMLEDLIQKSQGTEVQMGLQALRLDLLVQVDPEKAAVELKAAASKIADPNVLNGLAWSIVEQDNEGGTEVPDELLAAAVQVAEKAVELAPEDGAVLDTLSHLVYMQGQIDRAIELQTKAVQLAPDMEEIKEFLEALKKEKAAAK
jgi:thiol-disulfide isomerase/thioredoxin